ncbi:MAG: carbohydrate ABC transporter permease [Anaerolineales bacterium]|nr:carbohydrate ABC transporter permease [Anaerolineales bacterium]
MPSSLSRRYIFNRVLLYGAAILLALWTLAPLYLVALAAFSTKQATFQWPKPLLPTDFSTDTMEFFVNSKGVFSSVGNSVIVALLTIVASLILGAPGGYALARFRFRGKEAISLGLLISKMFPTAILSIPLAVAFIQMDLYDTIWGVALVHTAMALPFVIIVTAGIFVGVPRDLEEAAQTLGCNRLQAFLRVVMPLALPGLAAAAIFTFVISWNEVFAATILTLRNRTLPAQVLSGLNDSPLYYRYAGGFFMIVPALFFIFLIRKYLLNLWGSISR